MTARPSARERYTGRGFFRRLVWYFAWNSCLIVMKVFYRQIREGGHNMPDLGPVLIVGNHQSYFDPVAIGMCVTRRDTHFMARDSLFRIPVFGGLIRAVNSIPIRRGEGDTAGVRAVLDRLASGAAVLVFAEGTRTTDGRTGEFKRGTILLIKRAKCPVIPAAVEGAFDAWPRDRSRPHLFGKRIAAKLGEPIPHETLTAMGPDAAMALLHARVEALRLEMRAALRAKTHGAYPPPGPADAASAPPPIERGPAAA